MSSSGAPISKRARKAAVNTQLRERLFERVCSSQEGIFQAVVDNIKMNMDNTEIEDMEMLMSVDNEEILMEMTQVAITAFNKPKVESEEEGEGEGEGAQAGGNTILSSTVASGSGTQAPPPEEPSVPATTRPAKAPPGSPPTHSGGPRSALGQAVHDQNERQEAHARQFSARARNRTALPPATVIPERVDEAHDGGTADVEMATVAEIDIDPLLPMLQQSSPQQSSPATPPVNAITTAIQQGPPQPPAEPPQQPEALPPPQPSAEPPEGWKPSCMPIPPPPRAPPSSSGDKEQSSLPSSQSQTQIDSDLMARAAEASSAGQGGGTPGSVTIGHSDFLQPAMVPPPPPKAMSKAAPATAFAMAVRGVQPMPGAQGSGLFWQLPCWVKHAFEGSCTREPCRPLLLYAPLAKRCSVR